MMPNLLPMLFCAMMVAGCAARPPSDQSLRRVRVLTYNIHHGAGVDGQLDLPRIAAVISEARPDLVMLQEVDVNTQRTGGVDQAAELGRLTGMNVRFGKAIDLQGGAYGQALLSRWPINAFRVKQLPSPADAEQRIAVVAVTGDVGVRPGIVVIGTHLDHQHEAVRVQQAERLMELDLEKTASLTILGGDFNATPGSESMNVLLPQWKSTTPDDALTIPSPTPTKKIDWILLPARSPWRVINWRVIGEPTASDHRPVLVELEFGNSR